MVLWLERLVRDEGSCGRVSESERIKLNKSLGTAGGLDDKASTKIRAGRFFAIAPTTTPISIITRDRTTKAWICKHAPNGKLTFVFQRMASH